MSFPKGRLDRRHFRTANYIAENARKVDSDLREGGTILTLRCSNATVGRASRVIQSGPHVRPTSTPSSPRSKSSRLLQVRSYPVVV